MLDQIYYDEGEDVKESFLESSTATRKLPPRSLSWKVTLHLLQWTLICVLGLLALALYTQLRAMNAEAAGRVYCKCFPGALLVDRHVAKGFSLYSAGPACCALAKCGVLEWVRSREDGVHGRAFARERSRVV